jgi:hypothetical protein
VENYPVFISFFPDNISRRILTMTRFIYDEFSKDYLDELLSAYGKVKTAKTVASERREIDVYFEPYSSELPESLGLLGKLASKPCIFEPYRNPAKSQEIRACLGKLVAIEGEMIRESNRQKRYLKEDELPYLWILTPTASKAILAGFGAKTSPEWGEGIYLGANLLRMGIVVIHRLPVTPSTLLLRLLGKGKVQTRAIEEVESLAEDNPFKSIILAQLYNLQQNLFRQQPANSETQELVMRLAPLYQQDRAKAVEEGRQQGKQEGEANLIIRLLNRRFEGISGELEPQIRSLPLELLESLGEALFDFQSLEDVWIWLENHRLSE